MSSKLECVYSKVEPQVLLAIINRKQDCLEKRKDLCPPEECLQVSVKNLNPDNKFKPHRHNVLERTTHSTQEAWVVISGQINAKVWDINDEIAYQSVINPGDCLVALRGGHCFEVLENNTVLYEFKNGPYHGIDKDKTDIRG